MRTDDIKKITKMGFVVIRPIDIPEPTIEIATIKNGEVVWKICRPGGLLKTFFNKQERDKRIEELLEVDNIILD